LVFKIGTQGGGGQQLAVLHPRQLAVYSLTSKQVSPLTGQQLAVLHPHQLAVYSLTSKQVSPLTGQQLAVLHPHQLAVYSLTSKQVSPLTWPAAGSAAPSPAGACWSTRKTA